MREFIEKIKGFFTKKREERISENIFDISKEEKSLDYKKICKEYTKNFKPENDTILIIDDNKGMVSFLEEDFLFLEEEGKICLEDINILAVSGVCSGFIFEDILKEYNCLNIKWAIIDITLGGSKMTETGNLKLTGVDVFEMIYKKNKNFKFLFYTGNSLNPYIKENKRIIDQFKNITGKDISDNVLFKTSMDMDSRRNYIAKKMFNSEGK